MVGYEKADFERVPLLPPPNARRLIPRLRRLFGVSEHRLICVGATIGCIFFCYQVTGWRLDRESAAEIRALDLQVAPEFMGAKKIDRWGRMKRAPTTVQCSGAANAQGQIIDWSNSAICKQNAIMHSNCAPVCDPSYASCAGCSALQADHDSQLALAKSHCDQKSALQCPLNLKSDGSGKYDYVALSACCLNIPVGPDACFCPQQLSAAPTCFAFGQCLSSCSSTSKEICTGTSTLTPVAPLSCANPLALTCSRPNPSGQDLSCVPNASLTAGTCQTTCGHQPNGNQLYSNGVSCVTLDQCRYGAGTITGVDAACTFPDGSPYSSINLAFSSTVAASAETGINYATRAIDGAIGSIDTTDTTIDWAAGEDPVSLTMTWASHVDIAKIVLYDRHDIDDNCMASQLVFDSGLVLNIPTLPIDGSAHTIEFPVTTVLSLVWTCTKPSITASMVGLSEIQVYGLASNPLSNGVGNINFARYATVTASSETPNGGSAYKAVDGLLQSDPTVQFAEWVTDAGGVGSTLTLSWATAVLIQSIVLFDRPDLDNAVTQFAVTLEGNSASFHGKVILNINQALPDDGSPWHMNILNGLITNVLTFTVAGVSASTIATGLSEIQVFDVTLPNPSYSITVF